MKKESLKDIQDQLAVVYQPLQAIVFDEKRGHWGTEVELALTAAEQDLASAIEQIDFVRQKREGKRL